MQTHAMLTYSVLAILLFGVFQTHLRNAAGADSGGEHVLYVDDDAPLGGNGATWDTSFRFLQDALAAAAKPGSEVQEIRIAQGHYLPDRDKSQPEGSGDRSSTFELVEGIALRGGYAGLGEPAPDERDPVLYETVLSGDLAGDDAPPFLNTAENALHVVCAEDQYFGGELNGVVITAGNADGETWPDNSGGGMFHRQANALIVSCSFVANQAVHGGGLFLDGHLKGVIDCDLLGNRAERGGGLYGTRAAGEFASCRFSFNEADLEGGATFIRLEGPPRFTDCTFSENNAGVAGGAAYTDITNAEFTGCHFSGNSAEYGGGIILTNHALPIPHLARVRLTECTFSGNSALLGGAIYDSVDESADQYSTLAGCVVAHNDASLGGGLFANASAPEISDSTFYGNEAVLGGGLYNDSGTPNLTACTFEGNVAILDGGGFYSHAGASVLSHCEFTGNTAANEGAGAYADDESILGDCLFQDNTAWRGAGRFVFAGAPMVLSCTFVNNDAIMGAGLANIEGSPWLVDCLFESNMGDAMRSERCTASLIGCSFVANSGGATFIDSLGATIDHCSFTEHEWRALHVHRSDVTLRDSSFQGNYGGAVYDNLSPRCEISRCTFTGNQAESSPAVWVSSSATIIIDSTFTGNVADRSGGAIACLSAQLTIDRCVISGNSAGSGDPTHHGGGALLVANQSDLRVMNSLFSDNTADGRGGAVKIRTSGLDSVEFLNCAFTGNSATVSGSVLHTDDYVANVTNSIIWENGADSISGSWDIEYSCLEGGWPGTGNIDADPSFVDPAAGDYRLGAGSPCIDAADTDALPIDATTDLAVLPRFVDDPESDDSGHGDPPMVDMGHTSSRLVSAFQT